MIAGNTSRFALFNRGGRTKQMRELQLDIEKIISSGLFDPEWYFQYNTDVKDAALDPIAHYRKFGHMEVRDPSPLFCCKWYLDTNPDVVKSNEHPVSHYLRIGSHEDRAPSLLVAPKWLRKKLGVTMTEVNPLIEWITQSPAYGTRPIIDIEYLRRKLDLDASWTSTQILSYWQKIDKKLRPEPNLLFMNNYVRNRKKLTPDVDPLIHYLQDQGEKTNPHPLFHNDHVWAFNPHVRSNIQELTLLEHLLETGLTRSVDTSPLFDRSHYEEQTAIGELNDEAPILHYIREGSARGLEPHPLFDESQYRSRYLRELTGEIGICHYVACHREPHITLAPRFSERFYLARNPEVAEHFDGSPLEHFLQHGKREGRQATGTLWQDDFTSWDELRQKVTDFSQLLGHICPEISVIVPVYNQFYHTLRCIWTLLTCGDATRIQIIIADDGSTDETQEFFGKVVGLTYIRNEENLGFLRSCNAAAKLANAPFLFLLNNDTAVLPGALDALLSTARSNPDAGIVGSKLIYPDGTLQEAGGYVWCDGTGANAGRNGDPAEPIFNFRRDVDYVSGAAILIPLALWKDVGGFDEQFAPAYYEDTDLAMRLRNLGWRIIFEPQSEVVHFEGVTSGTSLESGVKQFQVINRDKFLRKWNFALEGHPSPLNLTSKNLPRSARPRILFIDHIVPEPDRDAGSLIAWSYLSILSGLGYEITFIPCNLNENGHYGRALRDLGIELINYPFTRDIGHFLEQNATDFDAFFLWRVNAGGVYAQKIRELCPSTPILFHTQDLHFLRMQRESTRISEGSELVVAAEAMREREMHLISIVDETILVSTHEQKYLRSLGCTSSLSVIPLVLDARPNRPDRGGREGIAFVGGFGHTPNVDAVMWFIENVWPLIRSERPDLTFHVVGSNPTREILGIEQPGIKVHGYVEDLYAVLDRMILTVVPLQYGAGIKGKIGSSLSAGVPVVSTMIGAEGMGLIDGTEIIIADAPRDFARAVLKVIDDSFLWNGLSEAGLGFIERNYATKVVREQLKRLLARSGVEPFSGICPITGRVESRRFTEGNFSDSLKAVPNGASSSDRVLAAAISRFSGYPGLPLRRVPYETLPKIAVLGDLPLIASFLENADSLVEASEAILAIARVPLDQHEALSMDNFLSGVPVSCTNIALACPTLNSSLSSPRGAPYRLSSVIQRLESSGWETRCSVRFLKECTLTNVALVEARRRSVETKTSPMLAQVSIRVEL